MSSPSPTTLAIAAVLEGALTPIVTALIAPLAERIKALEDLDNPVEDKLEATVLKIIDMNNKAVYDSLEDRITDCVNDTMENTIADKVHDVLSNGSFSVEFNG